MAVRIYMAADMALLLALSTLWGASYTFIKIGVETIPPVSLIAARTLIAGGIVVAIIRLRGLKLPSDRQTRSEEHTSELQSLMRISYAVFCLKKQNIKNKCNATKIIVH